MTKFRRPGEQESVEEQPASPGELEADADRSTQVGDELPEIRLEDLSEDLRQGQPKRAGAS